MSKPPRDRVKLAFNAEPFFPNEPNLLAPDRSPVPFLKESLKVMCHAVAPDGRQVGSMRPFKVDTGAIVTVFPLNFWKNQPIQQQIRWLHRHNEFPNDPHAEPHAPISLAGVTGSGKYFIGRIRLKIVSPDRNPALESGNIIREVTAAFSCNLEKKESGLLGLGGGAFERGGLCIDYDSEHGKWIIEA